MIVDDQFYVLRVGLEKSSFPLVIAVVSAQQDDGALFVATGLSVVFAQAGHQTLLLDAAAHTSGDEFTKANGVSPISNVVGISNLSTVQLASEPDGSRRPDVRQIKNTLGHEFAVTVINAPAITTSSVALEVSEWADHLIIAVRLGRRSNVDDQALKALLISREDQIVGVVPTRPNAHLPLETRESLIFTRSAKKGLGAVKLLR